MTIFYQANTKVILTLEFPSKRYFNEEVKKYCYMWKDGGEFSTDKYKFEK